MAERTPLERILLPLDLSPVSDKLVDFAGSLAAKYDSELILFHAIDSMVVEHAAAGFDPTKLIASLEEQARAKLRQYAEKLEERGVRVTLYPEIPVVDPVSGIVAAAAKEGASEILLATRGWGIRRLIAVGGTVKGVIKYSSVPVIAVRAVKEEGEVRVLGDPDLARSVAVGVDENFTEDMLAYAARLALKGGGDQVYLVHVIEHGEEEEARALLEKAAKVIEKEGLKPVKVILEGKPARVLARFAVPPAATSLVVGRTVSQSLGELILGSTLDRLLVEVEVPLIAYPVKHP